MNFGWSIETLKLGNKVARAGWNGKGMWLRLVPSRGMDRAYIEMKDATGMFVPWLASQTDMLAEDWELVDDVSEGA